MLAVTWPAGRARLVGEALLRRTATSALGQQMLDEIQGCAPEDLYALRLGWPAESYEAACKTLEGEVGRLAASIGRAQRTSQPTRALSDEQREIYEAMQDLKVWSRASAT
jgi:hypothetical protein